MMNARPALARLSSQQLGISRGVLDGKRAREIATDYFQVEASDQETVQKQADQGLPAPSKLDGQSLFAWYRHRELTEFSRLETKYEEIGKIAARAKKLVGDALDGTETSNCFVPCGADNGVRAQTSSARLFHDALVKMLDDARQDFALMAERETRLKKAASALGVRSDGSLNPDYKQPNFRVTFEQTGDVVKGVTLFPFPNGFAATPKFYYIRNDCQLEGHQQAAKLSFERLNTLRTQHLMPALLDLDKAHEGCDRLIAAQHLATR